ncbi:MAG: NAD(P)-dependent oxidoreductase [Planctomycetota bacterium]
MSAITLICGDRVAGAAEAFAGLGELRLLAAERIDAAAVRDADALVVRSTTRIDAGLVDGSRLRFVGSATVGVDHVDRAALAARGIAFAAAPGSSAASVAEFTWTAIVLAANRLGVPWRDRRLGVVGAGAIGERVARAGEGFGLAVRRLDPPRAAREPGAGLAADASALADCDLVSLHLPLENEGDHPTRDLVDAALLERLPRGAILVNTGRGATARNADLVAARRSGRLGGLVLDVWAGEPDLPAELAEVATLLSPHLAGRSVDGLLANTRAVAEALRRHFEARGSTPALEAGPGPELDGDLGRALASDLETATGFLALDAEFRRRRDEGARAFRELRDAFATRRDPTRWRGVPAASELADFLAVLRAKVGGLS